MSAAKGAGQRVLTVIGGLACLAALAVGSWAWLGRGGPTGPPGIDLSRADPAVAAVVEAACAGVRRAPNSAAAWGGLGETLLANQFPLDADACLARAESLDRADPRWPYLRAWGLLPRDREAGTRVLKRAVESSERVSGGEVAPLLLLAELYMEQDDRDQVEALCRRALERDPDNGRAHFDLGMIALTHNDIEICVSHLLQAAKNPLRSPARLHPTRHGF